MPLPIYVKADRFVAKLSELITLSQEMSNRIMSNSITANNNYMDAYIRTYAWKFKENMQIFTYNKSHCLYDSFIIFSTGSPVYCPTNKGYRLKTVQGASYEPFSTDMNSEENEFQLSMIYDEYELYRMYVEVKIREQFPEYCEFYLESFDSKRLPPAIKAIKELLTNDEHRPERGRYQIKK